ncbi:MAG: hypothetical protein JWO59_3122, partial [Chloroflexi bacterium]|nr:hypothetical protein [Chloroflexota bacterium]
MITANSREDLASGRADVPAAQEIRVVHLIFKTHLDLGFTDFARNVMARYRSDYIPRALQLARSLRESVAQDRFVWTTGSWLIDEYLRQGTAEERRQMESGIAAGDIAWHGLPCTFHSELADPSLFRFGLGISQNLDRQFGKHTIAAKMTDVPGHTRGIVPLLVEAGIRFLHIGVNPAATPPDVPSLFLWRDPGGAELVVMYDKGSYGGITVTPDLDEAIMFAHTDDNRGPQTTEQVQGAFRQARERFPGAQVVASTMDAFARALLAANIELPVVTAEIGDTWIHGAGSDPAKVARYRALRRLRSGWVERGSAVPDDFSRALLLIPEHTWGMDEKVYLGDDRRYKVTDFQAARREDRYRAFESSWAEQRAYVDAAVAALGTSDLAGEAHAALEELRPARPDMSGYVRVDDVGAAIETARYTTRIDPTTGAVVGLRDRATERDWATPANRIAHLRNETFGQEDYDRFWRKFAIGKGNPEIRSWAIPDLTKPGIGEAGARQGTWPAALTGLWKRQDERAVYLLAELRADNDDGAFGCPRVFTLEYVLPHDEPVVRITLQWFDKQATRLPEALWLSFNPAIPDPRGWRL